MLTTKEVYMRNFVGRRQFLKTRDRKSTRLNSSHLVISYAVFCLKKKKKKITFLVQIPSTLTTPIYNCHQQQYSYFLPDIAYSYTNCLLRHIHYLDSSRLLYAVRQ